MNYVVLDGGVLNWLLNCGAVTVRSDQKLNASLWTYEANIITTFKHGTGCQIQRIDYVHPGHLFSGKQSALELIFATACGTVSALRPHRLTG